MKRTTIEKQKLECVELFLQSTRSSVSETDVLLKKEFMCRPALFEHLNPHPTSSRVSHSQSWAWTWPLTLPGQPQRWGGHVCQPLRWNYDKLASLCGRPGFTLCVSGSPKTPKGELHLLSTWVLLHLRSVRPNVFFLLNKGTALCSVETKRKDKHM